MRRGFSLIEILIVVAIVVMLIGLLLWGGTKWKNSARTQQAIATVDALAGMIDEYEVSRRPSMRIDPNHPNAFPSVGPASSVMDTEAIIAACSQFPSAYKQFEGFAKITVALSSGTVVDYHGASVTLPADARLFKDPWGNYLWYKPSEPRLAVDPLWIPSDTKGGWVSAGPDELFGTADDVEPGKSH